MLHRAAAGFVLLLGATLLAVAVGCVLYLVYSVWSPAPAAELPGAPAAGADSAAVGVAASAVVALLSLGVGYALWSIGRRLPGAPAFVRPRTE